MILAVLVTFHRRMTHLHPPSTYHLYLALSLATIPTYLLSPLSCCGKRSPRSWHLALAMFSTMQIVLNFAEHRLAVWIFSGEATLASMYDGQKFL